MCTGMLPCAGCGREMQLSKFVNSQWYDAFS